MEKTNPAAQQPAPTAPAAFDERVTEIFSNVEKAINKLNADEPAKRASRETELKEVLDLIIRFLWENGQVHKIFEWLRKIEREEPKENFLVVLQALCYILDAKDNK